jgi:phosphohistidine phosphatase
MTVRRLVLLRHAKADNPPDTADEDRPLSTRGHADAQVAGAWLSRNHPPDQVICSPSKRTRQTWQAVSANLPGDSSPTVAFDRRIYSGAADDLLTAIRDCPDSAGTVLLIGHNPGISWLARDLDPERRLDSDGLRTCGIAVHTLDGAWSDYAPGKAPIVTTYTARGER